MTAVLLAAVLMVQPASELPADAEAPPPAPVSAVAVELLERFPASLEDWTPDGPDGPLVMQLFAMAGREDLIVRFDADAFTYGACPVLEGAALATAIDAARSAQIVIINEAHDQPLHRWTIQQLALALSGEFDVFAAETFNYLRLMEPREPGSLGWYDREPVFARQIAAVEAAGYRLAAYEIRADQRDAGATTREERIAVREEAQANNLIDVLADDPDARILVHVGYSHVLEAPQPQPRLDPEGEAPEPLVWFAARLKEKTGIDPLTISQTHCSPQLTAPVEGGEADSVTPAFAPGELMLADGADAAPEGAVDLFFAHAPLSFTDLRPDWRRAAGDSTVDVPDALLPADTAVIVEARAPGETLEHLPVDRVLIYPGETPVLLVPQGEWAVTAWTGDGAHGEPVTVTAP